jgi:hypothetical protein
MPKSPKKPPVKRASKAVKPKMMMTEKQAVSLARRLYAVGYDSGNVIDSCGIESGSKKAASLSKRMISCADALYKAAGVR